MIIAKRDGFVARLRSWFPDREFFMRSQGQVRFVRISSKLQMTAAAVVAAAVLVWLVAMIAILVAQIGATSERLALLEREAKVASAEGKVSQYRGSVGKLAEDLGRRQRFLEQVVESHVGDLPADNVEPAAVSAPAPAAGAATKIGAILPGAAGLERLEARQLAFADKLARLAETRAMRAEQAIRRVGLNPRMMMARLDDKAAQGGPLLALTRKGETLDPRFARLGASLARMSALERGLDAIPSHMPARLEFISSGFGYRSDPFTGAAALHAGLDFRGPVGAPILAAANGVVTFAGVKSGYGNCLEISHGNGMTTRYAHMSAFRATVGQKVAAGDPIGAIGNTGRSTGPHLHFEVRINDRAVNPRPFLEAQTHVLEKAGRTPAVRG